MAAGLRIVLYEKAFLALGAFLLVASLVAVAFASVSMGIELPGRVGQIDPAAIDQTPPFDAPGVRQVGENAYEVVMVGKAWAFEPNEVRVPAGADVLFTATTRDVIHGVAVEGTRVNMMLIPGQVSQNTYRFDEPGEYLLLCHEYCGLAHHAMYGKVVVVPEGQPLTAPAPPESGGAAAPDGDVLPADPTTDA
jgi:cytochrome c oxidase subunit 2